MSSLTGMVTRPMRSLDAPVSQSTVEWCDSYSLSSPLIRVPEHCSESLIRLNFVMSDQHESCLLEDGIKITCDDPGRVKGFSELEYNYQQSLIHGDRKTNLGISKNDVWI